MATATIKYFDTHEFVKKSKELGASEQLAIAQLKTELIKWMIGIGFITITSISGVVFTLLKLMIH